MLTGHGFNKLPTWAETLLKGDVSGGTNPKLSNGDRLEAVNGGSFINLRSGGVDGRVSISDVVYVDNVSNFTGIGTTTKQTNEVLNVNGGTRINSFLGLGIEPRSQGHINVPVFSNILAIAASTILFDEATYGLTFRSRRIFQISFQSRGLRNFVEFDNNLVDHRSINITSDTSDNTNNIQTTSIDFTSSYFDGTNSIDKTSRLVYNIDSLGNSNLENLIDGTTVSKSYSTGILETNTIQLTNGSTIKDINNNAFINMRSSNIDGRTSISDVLYVDSIGSRVGIGVTPTTHKLQILGDGTENLLKIGVPSRDYYFNINSLGQSHFFTFGSSQGGVSIGSSSSFTRLNNAVLSVFGNLSTSSVASFGNASTIGNTIHSPAGWRYTAGFTSFGDNTTENRGYVQPRNGTFTFYNASLTTKGLTVISNNDSNVFLGSGDATSVLTTTKSTLHFEGKYWDGSASVVKASSISFDANLDGTSNITHSVDGTNVIVLKSNGVLNYSNYPTSPTGLVAGDIWSDGGKLTVI